ncbi:MAG: DNA primase [Acidimicrobiia bacterium]
MGILNEDVARVREGTDIVALIGDQVALRRVGRRYTGLCPFHSEKTPSFQVNAELGLWRCWGCGKSGDAITFVRETQNLDFVGAVEELAKRANIQLNYDDASVSKDRQRQDRLYAAVGAAIDFYHRRLLESPDAGGARKYLRSRGFDGDAVRQFLLGFSPDSFDELSRHLQAQKFGRQDIADAGLAFVNRRNSLQDSFRARLMFPIHDARGNPVGFGARVMEGGQGPKYKNTFETPIYHKSRLLYGLHLAKAEIVARDAVIVCEGYTDVMGFALSGNPNAVATCGTALTDDHVRALKNLTRRIIVAFDADAAGQGATERFYRWEHELELDLLVADLPPGRDPGDLWRDDPDRLRLAIEKPQRLLQFKLDRLIAAGDLSSPEGRARVAEAAVPVLAEHPSELVREQYVAQVAGQLGIDHMWFKERLARPGAARRPAPVAPVTRAEEVRIDVREQEALRIAVHAPELMADRLDLVLFQDPTAREVIEALFVADTFHHALDSLDGAARTVLERCAVEEPDLGEFPEAYVTELVANLTEAAALPILQVLVRSSDERAMELKVMLDRLVRERSEGQWSAAQETTRQLVAWLEEYAQSSSTSSVAATDVAVSEME